MVGGGIKLTAIDATGAVTGASRTTSVPVSKAAAWFCDTFGVQLGRTQPKVQAGAGAAGDAVLRLGAGHGGAKLNLHALARTAAPLLPKADDRTPASAAQTVTACVRPAAPAPAAAVLTPITAETAAKALEAMRGHLDDQRIALRDLDALQASIDTPAGKAATGQRLESLASSQRELGTMMAAAKAAGADSALAALLPALRHAQEALAYQAVLTQQPMLGGRIESAPVSSRTR